MVSLGSAYVKTAYLISAFLLTTACIDIRPAPAAPAGIIDGKPTPAACTQLGFAPQQMEDEDGGGRLIKRSLGGAGTAAPGKPLVAPSTVPMPTGELCRPAAPAAAAGRRHRDREISRRDDQSDQARRRGAGLDLLDRRRHRLLRQCPPLPERRRSCRRATRCGSRSWSTISTTATPSRASHGRAVPRLRGGDPLALGAGQGDHPYRPAGLRHRRAATEPPLNLVFLVDVSGSMDDAGPAAAGAARR